MEGTADSGVDVILPSARGPIRCRFHTPPEGMLGATVLVGGTDGGLDGPADHVYRDLAQQLLQYRIASLRLDFRLRTVPGIVEEGVFDVLHGIAFLKGQGAAGIGLVGHSFGGAVVIAASAEAPEVSAVVTLATQSAGTQQAGRIAPRPLLLIHGSDDVRLPPSCSEYVYKLAGEPKELVILSGARHNLGQRRAELLALLTRWLGERLGHPVSVSPRES